MRSRDKFRKRANGETYVRVTELPDPVFLADFLVSNLLKPHQKFNIKGEKLTEVVSGLPDNIRDLIKGWVLIYLVWLFKVYTLKKYGMEFTNKLLLEAKETLQAAAENKVQRLWSTLTYWFTKLDEVSKSAGTSVNNREVPFEVLVALCFMVSDTDSPYYKNPSAETNMVEFDIGFILGSAAREAKKTIQTSIDLGAFNGEVTG